MSFLDEGEYHSRVAPPHTRGRRVKTVRLDAREVEVRELTVGEVRA